MNRNLYSLATVILAVAVSVASTPLRANETDDRIVSSAKNSYIFRTYLKDDSIKTRSKDGVVTLTGVVSEEAHKSMAQDTVSGLPGVKRVDNQLVIKGEKSPAERSDGWLG